MFEGCRTVRSEDHGACGPDQSALFKSIVCIKFKAILVQSLHAGNALQHDDTHNLIELLGAVSS